MVYLNQRQIYVYIQKCSQLQGIGSNLLMRDVHGKSGTMRMEPGFKSKIYFRNCLDILYPHKNCQEIGPLSNGIQSL